MTLVRIRHAIPARAHRTRTADALLTRLLNSEKVKWRRNILQRSGPVNDDRLRRAKDVGLERADIRIGITNLCTFNVGIPGAASHCAEPGKAGPYERMRSELEVPGGRNHRLSCRRSNPGRGQDERFIELTGRIAHGDRIDDITVVERGA